MHFIPDRRRQLGGIMTPKRVYATGSKKNPFRVRRQLPSGRSMQPRFRTEADALAWLADADYRLDQGLAPADPRSFRDDLRGGFRTFKEASDLWFDRRYGSGDYQSSTIAYAERMMRNWVNPYFSTRPLNSITVDDVDAFVVHMRTSSDQPLAPSTINHALWMVRSTFEHAIARGWIVHNPAATQRVKTRGRGTKPGNARYITLAESRAIAGCVRDEFRIGVWLQRLLGLRLSEMAGLQRRDIDLHARTAHITRQGGLDEDPEADERGFKERLKLDAKPRVVGLPQQLAELLELHLEKYVDDSPDSRILPTIRGGRGSGPYRRQFQRAVRDLGLEDEFARPANTHNLRKSYLSDVLAHLPVRTASMLAGHRFDDLLTGAAVTVNVYDLAIDRVQQANHGADLLERLLAEQVPEGIVLSDVLDPDEWLGLAEAAAYTGLSETYMSKLVSRGTVDHRLYRRVGAHPRRLVSRPSLEALTEYRAGRMSLSVLAHEVGAVEETVYRACKGLGIEPSRDGTAGYKVSVSLEEAQKVRELFARRQEFLAAHVNAAEVARTLKVAPATISTLARSGRIDERPAPDGLFHGSAGRWFTRTSVEQARRTRSRWYNAGSTTSLDERPKGYLTTAEAAALIGVSSDRVRSLRRNGRLTVRVAPNGRRIWIEKRSAERARAARLAGLERNKPRRP